VRFGSGRDLTSQDVKFTIEYSARTGQFGKLPKASYGFTFEEVRAVETPDPSTVVVRFKEPFVPFLSYLPGYTNIILPREIYDQDGHFKDRMAGVGPFQLDMDATQKSTRWVFKKHPTYWREGQPYLDEVHILILPEEPTRTAAFAAKQLHVVDAPHQVFKDLRIRVPGATVVQKINPTPGALFMSMSPKHPVMHDPRLRKAIALALNYEAFNQVQSDGVGGWPITAVPNAWFPQERIKQVVKYDPQRARQLVQEAYPNGVDLVLTSSAAGSRGTASAEEQLAVANLREVGINVRIDPVQTPERRRRLYSADFDLLMITEKYFIDPDSFYYNQYHESAAGKWSAINDPKLSKWVEQQRAELDQEKRKQIFWEMAKYLTENGLHIAVYRPVAYDLYHPEVRNFYPKWYVDGHKAGGIWLQR
jgi:peptide/nickel transport system substrate-binding protein